MARLLSFATLLLCLATIATAADDSYTINLKQPMKGETITVKSVETSEEVDRLFAADGTMIDDETTKQTDTESYWEQILAREPGKASTQLRRGYGEARSKINGKTQVLPFEGKIVLIEKKKGGFQFSIDGKKLSAEQAASLTAEFDDPDDAGEWKHYLPGKPVKVEESWNIKPDIWLRQIERVSQMEVVRGSAIARGRLLKVFKKDDRQYGVFVLHLEVPIKSLTHGKQKVPVQNAKVVMQETTEACIDGSITDATSKGVWHTETTSAFTHEGAKYTLKYLYRRNFEFNVKEGTK